MAAGVTQPGGAGTKICIYDDASSASGTGYTMAEISAAFPAVIVDNGTNRKSYRCIQDIQIGDTTTDSATTTLVGTNVDIYFDSGKTLRTRSTELTSWYLRLGTKIGTGDQAGGKDGCTVVLGLAPSWPRQYFIYGGLIRQTSGALSLGSTDGVSEMCACVIQSAATGTTPIAPGIINLGPGNLYNVGISHVTTAQVMNNFVASSAELISVACAAPTTFLLTTLPSIRIKDLSMFGSPTQSDLRWSSGVATGWELIRPRWTGNAAKFSAANAGVTIAVANAAKEYRIFDCKLVDAAGDGIAGIPVRLTDAHANVQVDTTTDSAGEITFGTGLTEKAVVVFDHYCTSGVYIMRDRSPFYTEINMSYQTGYNGSYQSHRYYWNWPGSETYTTTSGELEDVNDVIQMAAPASGGSTWVERIVP